MIASRSRGKAVVRTTDKANVLAQLPNPMKDDVSTLPTTGVMDRYPCQAIELEIAILWRYPRHVLNAPCLPTAPEEKPKLEFDVITD